MKKKLGISPESEQERFMQAIEKCRYCKHMKMTHSFLVDGNGQCIESSLDKEGIYEQCECKKYAPTDNLKYLSWEYERKQKKNKRERKKK